MRATAGNERERNRGHIGNKGYQRVVVLRGSTFRALADWPQRQQAGVARRVETEPEQRGSVRLAQPTKVLVQAICHVWRLLGAPFVRLMPFRLITFASDARTWTTRACVASRVLPARFIIVWSIAEKLARGAACLDRFVRRSHGLVYFLMRTCPLHREILGTAWA